MRPEQYYSSKTDFECRRENQDFEGQNISFSRPLLDLTPFVTNTTNVTTSPNDSTPVRTNKPELTPRTRPTDLPTLPRYSSEKKGKARVPGDLDPNPSLSDSSSKRYNLPNDINSSKSIKRKPDKKKYCRKHKKQDVSDSLLSYSDSSDNSEYRREQCKIRAIRKRIRIFFAQV